MVWSVHRNEFEILAFGGTVSHNILDEVVVLWCLDMHKQ